MGLNCLSWLLPVFTEKTSSSCKVKRKYSLRYLRKGCLDLNVLKCTSNIVSFYVYIHIWIYQKENLLSHRFRTTMTFLTVELLDKVQVLLNGFILSAMLFWHFLDLDQGYPGSSQ